MQHHGRLAWLVCMVLFANLKGSPIRLKGQMFPTSRLVRSVETQLTGRSQYYGRANGGD
jgi:hypothetical protein